MSKLLRFFLFAATVGWFAHDGKAQSLAPLQPTQYFTATGSALSGGKICTYVSGTTTPKDTYTTSALNVANQNPVHLNSAGQAIIWLGSGPYRIVVKTGGSSQSECTTGTTLSQQDGVTASLNGATTASANYVYAGPTTGAATAPAFRALVSADIPNNAASTSGNAATATALAANPTDCSANQFANAIAASGNLTCAAPALANLTAGALPATSTIKQAEWVTLRTAICQNATAIDLMSEPTMDGATAVCVTGTNTQQGVDQFTATAQSFQTSLVLPSDWTTGSGNDIEVRFISESAASAGSVVWAISTACAADTAASIDPAFNTAQTASVTAGANNLTNLATLSTFTTTGCAAGRIMYLKVELDASSTAMGNQDVLAVRVKLIRTVAAL